MIRKWSKKSICSEISQITFAATDPNMDGFNTWRCKQDLYDILFFVQEQLDQCGTYSHVEDEYLKKHDQELILRALGKK